MTEKEYKDFTPEAKKGCDIFAMLSSDKMIDIARQYGNQTDKNAHHIDNKEDFYTWVANNIKDSETDIIEETQNKPKPESVEALQTELVSFYGTENYYPHGLVRQFRWTDGIQFVCCRAEAFWLMDVVASYYRSLAKLAHPAKTNNLFWLCRLEVREDKTCKVDFREDTDTKPVITQEIPFTDFPLGTFEFYVIMERGYRNLTALLKSEY